MAPRTAPPDGQRPFWLDGGPDPASIAADDGAPAASEISVAAPSLLALAIAAGWLAGLWVAGRLGSADALTTPLGLGLIACLLAIAILQRQRAAVALAAVALAALVAGAMRYQPLLAAPTADDISHSIGATLTARGIVVSDPSSVGRWSDYRVRVEEIVLDEVATPTSGLLIARVPAYLDLQLDDRIELRGRVTAPTAGDEFSYREYLARQGIRATMAFPQARLVSRGAESGLAAGMAGARRSAALALERAVAEPSGPLAVAMVLGDRSGLPRDLGDAFNAVGATHIIAISGLNFVLAVAFLLVVLRPVRDRYLTLAITVIAITGYALLIGPQPSVVRAAIMAALFGWGRFLGRPNDTLTGLAVAAVGMTAARPEWVWDIGFQLSFVATAGLAVLSPPIERALRTWPEWLRVGVATTVAATVASAPITATSFGQVALASVPVTLLTVPVVGASMLTSAATIAAGLVWEPLSAPFGWLTWALLRYMVLVVEAFATLPGASLQIGEVNGWVAVIYYSLLLVVAVESRALGLSPDRRRAPLGVLPAAPPRSRRLTTLQAMLALGGIAFWLAAVWPGDEATVVTFVDVGQGDATLVRTAGGRTLLIDGGPNGTLVANALGRRLPFWDRRVDVLLVTHTHEDHIAGLIEVVRRFKVSQVIQPAATDRTPVVDRWEAAIRERGVERVVASGGQRIAVDDDTDLEVVTAPDVAPGRSPGNDASVVYRVTSNGLSVLVPGDLTRAGQRQLLTRRPDLESSVLKVPHHGAADALDDEFLAKVRPTVAVISVGESNRFGHPAASTLDQLGPARVFRTDLQGTVEIELGADGIRARTQR